jgi:glycosyltransferase involved in cell wall biosynthesis
MQPIISIVVVAYNVQSYILKCLQSIQNQTVQSMEVLIINDGSTDETAIICEEFVQGENRFRLITQENRGLSEARNCGIREAIGKYIVFVDGADFVEPAMYEKLLHCTEQQDADFVLCGYKKYWPDTQRTKNYRISDVILNQSHSTFYFLAKHNEAHVVTWNKLFLREIIIENELFFENHAFFDDLGFVVRYLSFASKIAIVDEPLYFNVQHENLNTKNYYHPIIEQSHEQTYTQLKQFFHKRKYRNVVEAFNLRLYIYRYHYILKTSSNSRRLKSIERQMSKASKSFSQLPWKYRMMKPLIQLRLYPMIFRLIQKVKV